MGGMLLCCSEVPPSCRCFDQLPKMAAKAVDQGCTCSVGDSSSQAFTLRNRVLQVQLEALVPCTKERVQVRAQKRYQVCVMQIQMCFSQLLCP